MKRGIFILFLTLFSCNKSEVISIDERLLTKVDTTTYVPQTKDEAADTVVRSDIPIDFNVSVEDWNE